MGWGLDGGGGRGQVDGTGARGRQTSNKRDRRISRYTSESLIFRQTTGDIQ